LLAVSSAADLTLSAPLFTESRALLILESDDKLSFYQEKEKDDRSLYKLIHIYTYCIFDPFLCFISDIYKPEN
jgi:hypothetical protein